MALGYRTPKEAYLEFKKEKQHAEV